MKPLRCGKSPQSSSFLYLSSGLVSGIWSATMVRPATYRSNGFDASPLLPLGALVVVAFMVFTPLTVQMMPMFVETSHQMFSFMWVVPVIIVAALFLTSSEMLAPSYPQRRPLAYQRYNTYHPYQSQYGGESPSWGLLGLMLLLLLMLPWRY